MSDIFISHSSTAGPQVRAFIDAFPARLRERGLAPFLDASALRPGDVWRPILYSELARCKGAVLVLGPEALERPWVAQEATILAWRRALRAYNGRSMVVVATLLDGLTRRDVERRFPSLNLGETEFARPGSSSEDTARTLAAVVAKQFPVGRDLSDPFQDWTARVGSWLGDLDDLFLRQVATALRLDTDVDDDQLCDALADGFFSHDGTLQDLERALVHVVNSRTSRAMDIVSELAPVVVPAGTARSLLSAARQPRGERVVALNSDHLRVGRLFVRRATCCDPMVLLAEAPLQMGESEEGLYAGVRSAIGEAAGVGTADEFDPGELAQLDRPLVVLIKRRCVAEDDAQGIPHNVLSRLLTRLRREFDTCVFLVLTGPDYDQDVDALTGLPGRAEPPLKPEQAAWPMMMNRLYRQASSEVMT